MHNKRLWGKINPCNAKFIALRHSQTAIEHNTIPFNEVTPGSRIKMVFDKEFPRRHTNHILETMSYKIFNNALPNNWMVRELTERDYGFDALVELTTQNNEVNGKIAAIQLKASSQFIFNTSSVYKHYAIDKRTTNLWLSSNIITFVFLLMRQQKNYISYL